MPAALPAELPADLAAVLAEIVPPGGAFRHREHIHLAYLAVQRHGADRAADKVSGWIRHLAAYQRAPQKFNATVTRAWTEIVAHHMAAVAAGHRLRHLRRPLSRAAGQAPAEQALHRADPGFPGRADRLGRTRPGALHVTRPIRHARTVSGRPPEHRSCIHTELMYWPFLMAYSRNVPTSVKPNFRCSATDASLGRAIPARAT